MSAENKFCTEVFLRVVVVGCEVLDSVVDIVVVSCVVFDSEEEV